MLFKTSQDSSPSTKPKTSDVDLDKKESPISWIRTVFPSRFSRIFLFFKTPSDFWSAKSPKPRLILLNHKKARVSPLPRHYQPTSFWWLLPLYSYFGGFSTFYFFSSSVALPVTFSFLPLWLSGFIVFFVFLFFYFFGVLATSSLLFSHPNTTTFLQKQKRTQQPQKIEYFFGRKAHHPFLQKRRRRI